MYLNGVNVGSATSTNNIVGTNCYIGQSYDLYQATFGYIDDLRVTKGVARYTANFTPPTSALPTHEILDRSVYQFPVTSYGNAQITTTVKKYGSGAMYFDGSGDFLSIPASTACDLRMAAFTIEYWVRRPSSGGTNASDGGTCIMNRLYNGGAQSDVQFGCGVSHSSGQFWFGQRGGSGALSLISTTTITTDTWYHFAVCLTETGSLSMYINGKLDAVNTSYGLLGTNGTVNNNNIYIGYGVFNTQYLNGYLDDIRITKGVVRYTANFVPPTKTFPTIPVTISGDPWWGNVSLLLNGDTTDTADIHWPYVSLMLTGDDFIDWSNQHNAITNNGTVTLDTTNKKFNSSSLAFSGTKYLSMPSNTAFDFGTGDFTVECWIRFTTVQDCAFFQTSNNINAENGPFWFGYSGGKLTASRHGSASYALGYTWTPTTGFWYPVAVTRQSGTTNVYLNGSVVATSSTIHNGVSFTQAGAAVGVLTTPAYFQGQIADLRITKGIARTITVPTAALPAFKIQDRTQNNLTVTPYGNVQLITDVMRYGTGSMFFDGSGDYVQIENSSNLSFNTTDNFTVEWWMMPLGSGTRTILLKGYYGISIVLYSNQLQIGISYSSIIYYSNTVFTSGNWYHCALVRDLGTLSLYVNGVFDKSAADTGNYTTSLPMTIGVSNAVGLVDYFNGYIDDFRITKGYARYTRNFTPPSQSLATQYISTGYDANYADVSLLLNGSGTNGSTTFTDLSSSPKTITAYSDAKISTAVKKYGTGSMAFDGNGDWVTTPNTSSFDFSSSSTQFTIEAWVYPGANNTYRGITGARPNAQAYGWCIYISNSNILSMGSVIIGNSYADRALHSTAIPVDTWTHIAVVKTSAGYTAYVNGVAGTILSLTGGLDYQSAHPLIVGALGSQGEYPFTGYIDDFRITKGIARYTANFTPPTYQLPTDTTGTVIDPLRSSTSLLLRGNGTNGSTSFVDESPNGLTITNTGSVNVNTTTKKYGTGSIFFDGSGDYLTAQNSNAFTFGTGDFTIEGWYYFIDGTANAYRVMWSNYSSWSSGAIYYGKHISYSGNVALWVNNYSASQALIYDPNPPTNSTWIHYAVTRSGNTVRLFRDGVSVASTTLGSTIDFTGTNDRCIVGMGDSIDIPFYGYMDDIRITNGYARYTANFTPPTYENSNVTSDPVDYNVSQVALLISGNGSNGSTAITDSSSNKVPITVNGATQISVYQKKFGTGAIMFDGTNDYLTISDYTTFALGTNDFTIELWIYPTTLNAYAGILSSAANTSPYWTYYPGGWQITFGASSSAMGFAVSTSTGAYWASTATSAVPLNQWNHIAVTRSGLVIRKFINGILDTTDTMPGNYTFTSDGTSVVGKHDIRTGMDFTGYMDDIRITKGVARYTTSFSPQPYESPVPNVITYADYFYNNVVLLLTGDGKPNGSQAITDLSGTPKTITVNGNAQITTTVKKHGTGSIAFDGTTDYLTIPDSSQLQITSGNFTIELWSYPLTGKSYPCLFSNYNSTTWNAGTGVGLYVGHAGISDTTHYKLAWNGVWPKLTSSATIVFNVWTHIALVKNGSTVTLYLNGIADSSFTDSSSSYTAPMWWIGTGGYTPNNSDEFKGYIDDFRITKGIARYTGTFIPPYVQLPTTQLQYYAIGLAPAAPTGVSAVASFGQAVVSFTSVDNGGDLITSYTVTSSGGHTTTGTNSPITVTGLAGSTNYTFTVVATNIAGTNSPASSASAVVTTSANIVSSGLVFYVDAVSTSSYSGSGTTWYDLSTNALNLTVGSGTFPTFSTNSFVFSSQHLQNSTSASSANITNNLTIEAWINMASWVQYGSIICFGTDSGEQWSLNSSSTNGLSFGSNWPANWLLVSPSSAVNINTWYCIHLTYSSNTVNWYINGSLNSTVSLGVNPLTTVSEAFISVGANIPGGDEYFNGKIGNIKLYNRVLTTTEMSQNFTAHRSTYGI
jgi:hypothetical protein